MKISRIGMRNFKGFGETLAGDEIEIELNQKSTIFYGVNGSGKSTILSAVSYALWPLLNRINISQGKNFQTMSADLLHIDADNKRSKKCEVMVGFFDDANTEDDCEELFLTKSVVANKNKSSAPQKADAKFLARMVDYFQEEYLFDENNNQSDSVDMPVFLYYGTNRTVLDIPLRIKKTHTFSKRDAIARALENYLDFRTFFEWYRNQEDYEQEVKIERQDFTYEDKLLRSVRKAILAMLDDISDLKVKRAPLRMVAIKNGVEYRVEQLSDGEKCTLALLGDIARRVAIANPTKENPLEGDGVIMIDEIDLHMHPGWQRKILGVLKSTFPNIQFIVTTHSPQVLGEVDDTYNLYRIQKDPDGRPLINLCRAYGKDSSTILRTEMNVRDRSKSATDHLEAFDAAMDRNDYEAATNELKWLELHVGEDGDIVSRQVQLTLEQM